MPDRRGIPHFHTYCDGDTYSDIYDCLEHIDKFIKNTCNGITPLRITCRVNHLGTRRMHWHLHYERNKWEKIIRNDKKMNIYAVDMTDEESFKFLILFIDFFKFFYSKQGWKYENKRIATIIDSEKDTIKKSENESKIGKNKKINRNDDGNNAPKIGENVQETKGNNEGKAGETNEGKQDELKANEFVKISKGGNSNENKVSLRDKMQEMLKIIQKDGFYRAKNEARVYKGFDKLSITRDLVELISLVQKLKKLMPHGGFDDKRFGVDFEGKVLFIEIKWSHYKYFWKPKIWPKFVDKIKQYNETNYKNWKQMLYKMYGRDNAVKISKYCEEYFKKNKEVFKWHKNKV